MTSFEKFCLEFGKRHKAYCLAKEVYNDLTTPVMAYLNLGHGKKWSFLFESASSANNFSRYSFIGFDPDLIWKYKNKNAEISTNIDSVSGEILGSENQSEVCLSLNQLIVENSKLHENLPSSLPSQVGGLFGFLSYNTINLIERRLQDSNPDLEQVEDGIYFRPRVLIIFDQLLSKITITYTIRPDVDNKAIDEAQLKELWQTANKNLDKIISKLQNPGKIQNFELESKENKNLPKLKKLVKKDDYIASVKKAIKYIYSGEACQIVLAQKYIFDFDKDIFDFYRSLRQINPSPYLFFINFYDFTLVGSSPEIMIRLINGKLTLRPLAGSRPRGADVVEDKFYEDELLADPKERAEHLMLLDLGRNDVGRVAKADSVLVDESFKIERYSSVMHISSSVSGTFDESLSKLDALFSGLPAGTVSGAPKIRAMEIIDELETYRRGFYAGTLGYFDRNQDFDTCILLRSALFKNNKLYMQTGAGIVANSDPEHEYEECMIKLKALTLAYNRAYSISKS